VKITNTERGVKRISWTMIRKIYEHCPGFSY